jgi:putative hydrolase of HD superfamily
MDIDTILSFTRFTRRFENVTRRVYRIDDGWPENDAEHSCQLALMAWFIIEERGLELDLKKVLQYALAHDLVEAYAGDTPAFENNEDGSKEIAEEQARKRIMNFRIRRRCTRQFAAIKSVVTPRAVLCTLWIK